MADGRLNAVRFRRPWGGAQQRRGWMAVVLVLLIAQVGWVSGVDAEDGSSGFGDVSDSAAHAAGIKVLESAGMLAGTECSEGLFCPADGLERWVMAVWLVRALDGGDPSGSVTPRFGDVDAGMWWAGHAERLAELGVTLGCSADPLLFCPSDVVTRGQMATFLVRAFGLAEAAGAGFADTAGSVHQGSIDALAAAGVTAGCEAVPLRYCPRKGVTRAQMATFLARALGLVPLPEGPTTTTGGMSSRIAYSVRTDDGRRGELWRELWIVDSGGSGPVKLDGDALFGGWSPDGSHVAWTVLTDSGVDLWVGRVDGTGRVKLDDKAYPRAIPPSHPWSPDGMHYVWIALADPSNPRERELWVARVDGRNRMKLGDTRYFDGWSPDSKHLAWNVPTQHGPRLEVGGVDGTRVNLGFIGGFGSFLGWSADGQQFAWIVGPRPDQLRTASTDGERLLTVDGLNIPIYVSLSPDGGYLAWAVKSVVSSDELELWVGDVGGEDQVKVTDGWLLNTGHPVWSPDSEHIAWISTEDTRTELWVSNANGKSHTKIADDAALAGWSPDSEYVAWIVTEDTRTELWVGSASGGSRTKIADDAALAGWSPDSKHTAWTMRTDNGTEFWVGSASGGSRTKIADDGSLLGLWGWSPDGRHTAWTMRTDDGTEFWVGSASGGSRTKIADDAALAGWSPDGEYVAWIVREDTRTELWVGSASGGSRTRIADDATFHGWSPR